MDPFVGIAVTYIEIQFAENLEKRKQAIVGLMEQYLNFARDASDFAYLEAMHRNFLRSVGMPEEFVLQSPICKALYSHGLGFMS